MRRIGILGAGAMGTLFAYQLASRTTCEVRLLARSPVPSRLRLDGLGPVAVTVESPPTAPVDFLIVLVKAYATKDALRWAAAAIGPETVGLTLQNGLGNAEALAMVLGPGRVLAGTTAQGATLLAPGHVRHGGAGPTHIAPWQPEGPAAQVAPEVAALLTGAGIPTSPEPDPRPLLWAKLCINCGINALTALLRVPNGDLLCRPGARRLMTEAAREAAAVAAAAGVALAQDPVAMAAAVAEATTSNRSSMLQDVEHGRRTEIDALNGAVADLAEALGVPAPVNRTLAELVRALQA